MTAFLANHFTYHVPRSQDDGPRSDMAASATPGGVQSISTWFKMMHVLHERGKKHLEHGSSPGDRKCPQRQQLGRERRGTPTHCPEDLRTPRMTTNAKGGRSHTRE